MYHCTATTVKDSHSHNVIVYDAGHNESITVCSKPWTYMLRHVTHVEEALKEAQTLCECIDSHKNMRC